jgi:hypothetical protein
MNDVPIAGLRYVKDYLSAETEAELAAAIDCAPWIADLRRRVQHYS